MRIAQVSPLFESVPPRGYGGTERVVSYLTEALVSLGHEVTLFAAGDSHTSARLLPMSTHSLRLDEGRRDDLPHHVRMLEHVSRRASEFDIIHWHLDYLHFPLSRRLTTPQLTTQHGRLDGPDLAPLFGDFRDLPLVSISDAQRAPLPRSRWVRTVYHGLPPDLYTLGPGDGGYFAFVGRISRVKRVDRAVAIAKRLGAPLRIAAKIARADQEYFEREFAPLLSDPSVQFLGELDEHGKRELLGHARALLFPIDWPEPFGLVMIEAMACGTPVIAFRAGSVPEILEDGVTGYSVESEEQAVEAGQRLDALDRRRVRAGFEARFTSEIMAENYVRLYEELASSAAIGCSPD